MLHRAVMFLGSDLVFWAVAAHNHDLPIEGISIYHWMSARVDRSSLIRQVLPVHSRSCGPYISPKVKPQDSVLQRPFRSSIQTS